MLDNIFSDAIGKLTLRLTVGILILFHGVGKIMHPGSLEFIGNNLSNMGLPSVIAYGVFIGEVIAPLMVITGFHARVGGLIVVVNMIFAVVLLTQHGGWALELQAFYLLGGISVALLGSGKFAIKPD